jgi:hypothetical protein
VLSGGDIAPLGAKVRFRCILLPSSAARAERAAFLSQAVTEIHAMFDWAAHTKRGMLIFIDEAVSA